MPTYDYRCRSCDHTFEAQQSFADDPLTICPECGEPSLRKLFNSVGISFKGSGFYKNDSRSSSTSSGSTSSKSAAGSEPSSGSSSDSSGPSGDASSSSSGTSPTTAGSSSSQGTSSPGSDS